MPNVSINELNTLVYNIAIYNSEASYKKMFGLLFNSLFRFSYCMLKSRELAEEVASDVMFKLWQKRMELLQVENVQVYALVIARNLSLNALKKGSADRFVSLDDQHIAINSDNLTPEQLLIDAQNKADLQKSTNALPTRCKLVFKLIKEEGLSYKEVAEVLNISPKTVDAHLVTAMKKLSKALNIKFYCS
ncbi:MAG TPA: sigma-70 family RNA polymerase sigma factor [Chitinophagaceae bacterium]|nr:sigma-70 family RNA polymerase sigma factor [Chitinophagaceae bacterium]